MMFVHEKKKTPVNQDSNREPKNKYLKQEFITV